MTPRQHNPNVIRVGPNATIIVDDAAHEYGCTTAKPSRPFYDDEGLISVNHRDERIQLHTDAEIRAATLSIGNRAKRRREAAKLRRR